MLDSTARPDTAAGPWSAPRQTCTLAVLSDIHFASAAEQARGDDFELKGVSNPVVRQLLRIYRHRIWLRWPLRQNYLLKRFLEQAAGCDFVVANGDYTCDTAAVGVSDEAACQSVRDCLEKLRVAFMGRFQGTFGDHELGKVSFVGGRGGMRLASWHRAVTELGLSPFWQVSLGCYRLIGVASSLVALPVFEPDTLDSERGEWERLRAIHLEQIRVAFGGLAPEARVLLFCHDPSALPFLWELPEVRAHLGQIEQTVLGHLHSNLVFRLSGVLAGMPPLGFLGHTARRMTTALRQARLWPRFKARLCPALAGIQLLNDGGYLTAELDLGGRLPARFQFHPLARSSLPEKALSHREGCRFFL